MVQYTQVDPKDKSTTIFNTETRGDDETKEVSWTTGKTPIRWITPETRNGAIQALIATTFQNVETSRDDPTLDLLVELAGSKVWQEKVNECVILTL